MSIQLKRQGNLNAISCTNSPIKPNSLSYGELAVDSLGYIYIGNGYGQVVSLIRAADRAAIASSSDISTNALYSDSAQKALLADNATMASTAELAKDSNMFAGQNIDYFAKASDFDKMPFLYSTLFSLDNWEGDGPYIQTSQLIAEDGGPNVSRSSIIISSPMCEQTPIEETNNELLDALNILNKGYLILENNQISAQVFEKPISDIRIFLVIKN